MGAQPSGPGGRARAPHQRRRGAARVGAVLLLAAVIAAGGWLLRYHDDTKPRAVPDTLEFARVAYGYAGYADRDARLAAHDLRCDYWRPFYEGPLTITDSTPLPSSRVYRISCSDRDVESLLGRRNLRYERIFDSRPGYPALVAVLIPLLGPHAFAAVVLAAGVATGVLLAAAVLAAGGGARAAAVSVAVLYALPSGTYLSRLQAESLMAASIVLALLGALLVVVRHRHRWGTALLVAGLGAAFVTKSANGVLGGAALAVGGLLLVLLARGPRARRSAWVLAGGATVSTAALLVAGPALGWPGAEETLQDLYTWHFTSPDVEGSVLELLPGLWPRNQHMWSTWLSWVLTGQPLVLLGLLAALAGTVRAWGPVSLLWWLLGLTGVAAIAAHPVGPNLPRLILPLWIPTAAGLGLLVELALRHPRRTGTDGGEEGGGGPGLAQGPGAAGAAAP